jgi:hypothetical protein
VINKIILAFVVFGISGCATDPTLAFGVKREGGGVYTAGRISKAVEQCQISGQKLNVMTSTSWTGISGREYPVIAFRCE